MNGTPRSTLHHDAAADFGANAEAARQLHFDAGRSGIACLRKLSGEQLKGHHLLPNNVGRRVLDLSVAAQSFFAAITIYAAAAALTTALVLLAQVRGFHRVPWPIPMRFSTCSQVS